MKWFYIPFMFILAFSYTKFSFNNSERQEESELALEHSGRTPASTIEVVENRPLIKRVPAAILYQNLSDRSLLRPFEQVSSFYGTVAGDVGVESFGFIVDDKGKTLFALRDLKEVSKGYLYHDVIGHLVSAKNYDKKISWLSYFEAYKSGLLNEKHTYSYYVEKGLDEAFVDVKKIVESNISPKAPFVFTKMKSDFVKPTKELEAKVKDGLRRAYPDLELFDIYESAKEKGRFQLLVRVRPMDKIEWLEVVESKGCEYEKAFQVHLGKFPFSQKMSAIKEHVYAGKLDRSLASVNFDKKDYIIKPADHFAAKLQLEVIPTDDYHDIVLDEAYVLGKMHRASLGNNVDDYVKAWARIPAAMVDEKAVELKYKLKDMAP